MNQEIERLLEDGSRRALYEVLRYSLRKNDKDFQGRVLSTLPFKPFAIREEKVAKKLMGEGFILAGRKWKQYPACKCSKYSTNKTEIAHQHLMIRVQAIRDLKIDPWKNPWSPSHCSLRKCRKRHLTWLLLPPEGESKTKAKEKVDLAIKHRK